jgi:peptide/nickel transport system permease protein
VLALVGFSLPAFWVGAELIVIFAVWRNWFPATGYVSLTASPAGWLHSLVLPVISLSLYGIAATAKQTRESMLDVLGSEYIRMARANGLSSRSIVLRHALRNASMRVVTVLGLQAVGLLGGTVLVENVFALPGLGSLMVTAATEHDLPVVAGMVVYFTLIVVVINLLVDLAYLWLNPRVRIR